jgi:hypothetical protein
MRAFILVSTVFRLYTSVRESVSDCIHWTLYSNTVADYVAGSNVRYHYIIQFLFCNLQLFGVCVGF